MGWTHKVVGAAAIVLGMIAPQAAVAQSYTPIDSVIEKLSDLSPECLRAVSNFWFTSGCDAQTYLVQFPDDQTQELVEKTNSGQLVESLDIGSVSAFSLNGRELAELARNNQVLGITANSEFTTADTQSTAPWQLDRIDQANLPLDSAYTFDASSQGQGVRVYVVDTGVNASHSEFTGRVGAGYSAIGSDASDTLDCNGHGTHVAGLAAGTTYGAAKQATIIPVRVLDCDGTGTLLGVLMGLDWIARNTQVGQAAVVNMSLGGESNFYLDSAVESLTSQGLAFVVAAGNTGTSACNTSPARVAGAITVAASGSNDSWPSFSNSGSCVDVIAPGVQLRSAGIGSASASTVQSGTSMAAGVVSGVVATQMSGGYQSPSALSSALTTLAVTGKVTSVPAGTANLLLQNTIGFTSSGSATGAPVTVVVPEDGDDQVSVDPVDPTPDPAPTTPTPVAPPKYSAPTVSVTGSTATVSWQFPTQTTALLSQVLKVFSGTTELSSVQLSNEVESFVIPDLVAGVVYKVQIAGANNNGVGEFSDLSAPFSRVETIVNGPAGGEFSSWTKRISDTQVKFYVKFPQPGVKIQFMLQQPGKPYREVAWMRLGAADVDENGLYRNLTNGVYFIRTINLVDGKNRFRILVDGQQVDRTRTYASN